MKTNSSIHIPVLKDELIEYLNIKPNGTYVDCTAGFGGHSSEILKHLKDGKLICIDQDINAINHLNKLFKAKKNVQVVQTNFENLDSVIRDKVDGIIFDLGVSSLMFDDPKRGFSYRFDGPLDMRMNQSSDLTAKDIVNNYTREQLVELFRKYGEETNRKVIDAIINYRKVKPIETTLELADIISDCYGNNWNRKHPAKTYFQALRIEVNKELDVLVQALSKATHALNKEARICVITFQSLEDRIVKNYFRDLSQVKDLYGKEVPISVLSKPEFKLITKKPIVATDKELKINNRSHSAKLRVLEKI